MADDMEYIDAEQVAVNNLQVYQQDKAIIDMQIATARKYPRNLKRCIDNAITMVTMDVEIAKSCTYALNKGGTAISGPSVNLAKILAQQFGNMRIENRVVGYDDTHVICEGVCFDLETNFAVRTQVRKSIIGSTGTKYKDDMIVTTGNALNAIALRNAVFAVISPEIVKKVYNAAKEKITGKVKDESELVAKRTAVFNGLKQQYAQYALTDEEICKSVNKKVIEHVTLDDIFLLIGFENALKTTETSFESIFRPTAGRFIAIPQDKSEERLIMLMRAAKTKAALEVLKKECNTPDTMKVYDEMFAKLK